MAGNQLQINSMDSLVYVTYNTALLQSKLQSTLHLFYYQTIRFYYLMYDIEETLICENFSLDNNADYKSLSVFKIDCNKISLQQNQYSFISMASPLN